MLAISAHGNGRLNRTRQQINLMTADGIHLKQLSELHGMARMPIPIGLVRLGRPVSRRRNLRDNLGRIKEPTPVLIPFLCISSVNQVCPKRGKMPRLRGLA